MKIHKVKVPLYFHSLKIVVAKDLCKAFRRLKVKANQDPKGFASFAIYGKNTIKVFVKPNVKPSIIAHEAVHVVNFIFKNCGVELDRHNDEAQAYLTGWVVGKITKFSK